MKKLKNIRFPPNKRPNQKRSAEMKRYFTEVQMTKECMKKISTSLAIKEL